MGKSVIAFSLVLTCWCGEIIAQKKAPSPLVEKFVVAFERKEYSYISLAEKLRQDENEAGQAVEFLCKAIADNDPVVRFHAAKALACLQPYSHVAVMHLEVRLADTDPKARRQAMLTLGAFGPKGKAAVPALIAYLKEMSAVPTRKHEMIGAVSLLGHIGIEAAPAVPTIIQLYKRKDPKSSAILMLTLGRIGANDESARKLVLKTLKNESDPAMQEIAARAVGEMGPIAKDAVPVLIRLLDPPNGANGNHPNTHEVLRCSAAYALGNMQKEAQPAIPTLAKILTNRKELETVRNSAAVALKYLAPVGKEEAIFALFDVLCDPASPIKGEVQKAIGAYGKAALPRMEKIIKRGNRYERMWAISTVPFIGAKDAQSIIPLLRKACEDPSVAIAAKKALYYLGEPVDLE